MAKTAVKEKPARKTATQREKEKRLTDDYAAAARKNEQRRGDELSELEPVGRTRSDAKRPMKK